MKGLGSKMIPQILNLLQSNYYDEMYLQKCGTLLLFLKESFSYETVMLTLAENFNHMT